MMSFPGRAFLTDYQYIHIAVRAKRIGQNRTEKRELLYPPLTAELFDATKWNIYTSATHGLISGLTIVFSHLTFRTTREELQG